MNLLLDTNILLIYLRKQETANALEEKLQLFGNENTLIVSVVTIGEIKSIALQNSWGVNRLSLLDQLLSSFLITDINTEKVIAEYARKDAFSQGKLPELKSSFSSKNMGKNDLWIAATASAYNLTLVTTDQDFSHLEQDFFPLIQVNTKEL